MNVFYLPHSLPTSVTAQFVGLSMMLLTKDSGFRQRYCPSHSGRLKTTLKKKNTFKPTSCDLFVYLL